MNSLSVLIVEDHEEMRRLMAHWLKRRGYEVVCAANGHEACRLARSRAFDLVITDVMMPEGGGLLVIMELKKAGARTRILALSRGGSSNLANATCLTLAEGAGAHATAAKPSAEQELVEAIAQAGVFEKPLPPDSPIEAIERN